MRWRPALIPAENSRCQARGRRSPPSQALSARRYRILLVASVGASGWRVDPMPGSTLELKPIGIARGQPFLQRARLLVLVGQDRFGARGNRPVDAQCRVVPANARLGAVVVHTRAEI